MKPDKQDKPAAPSRPDWWDDKSGCYCVVCLAPVREDVFKQRGGTCPRCEFDDPPTYG